MLFGAIDGDGDLGEFLVEKDNLSRVIHPSGQLRKKPFQGGKEENLDDLFPVRVVAGVFLLVFYTPIIPVITTIAFKVTFLLFLGRHNNGFRGVIFGFLGFQFFGDGSPLPFFRYGKYRIFRKILQEVARDGGNGCEPRIHSVEGAGLSSLRREHLGLFGTSREHHLAYLGMAHMRTWPPERADWYAASMISTVLRPSRPVRVWLRLPARASSTS